MAYARDTNVLLWSKGGAAGDDAWAACKLAVRSTAHAGMKKFLRERAAAAQGS